MFISDDDRKFIEQRCSDETARDEIIDLFNARYSEQFHIESVLSELRDTVFQTDIDGQWIFLSPTWEDLMGLSVVDCLGTACVDYVHADDKSVQRELFSGLVSGEITQILREVRCQHVSGTTQIVEVHAHPIKAPDGSIIGTTGILRDVTRRQRDQQMLHAYRNIVSSTQDGISLINRDYTYRLVNDAYLMRLALPRDQVEGQPMGDVVDPEVFNEIIKPRLDRCFAGETQEYVTWFEYPGVGWRCVRVMYYPYREGTDEIVGAIINSRDITDEKHAENQLRIREQRFRTLAENSPDLITRLTRDGTHLYANPAWAEAMGYTVDEIIGKRSDEIYAMHDGIEAYDPMREYIYKTGQSVEIELTYPAVQGERYYHLRLVPEFDDEGNVETILSVARDITERKISEDRLAASQDTLYRLIEQLPVGIQLFDASGTCTHANQTHLDIFGIHYDDIVGEYNIFEDPLAEQMTTCDAALRALEGQTTHLGDLVFDFSQADPRFADLERGIRNVAVTIVPIFDVTGTVTGFAGVNVDITERKRIEENLRRSEEKYRLITENTSDGILVWDEVQKAVTYVSPNYEDLWETEAGQIMPRNERDVYDRVHPDDRDALFADIQYRTEKRVPSAIYTYRVKHNDGTYRWREDRANYVYDEDGKLLKVYLISRDITERQLANEALSASEELLRTIIDHIPVMISLTDAAGNLIFSNPQLNQLFDWQLKRLPPKTDPMTLIFPDTDLHRSLAEYIEQTNDAWVDVSTKTQSGNQLDTTWMTLRLRDGSILSIGLDITARKHAQQRELEYRLERERMLILNNFVRSAAHEFRTPLSIIGTSVYLLQRSDDPQKKQAKLDQITSQVQRITRLVDMMLQMVKLESQQPMALSAVDLDRLLRQIVSQMRSRHGDQPKLKLEVAQDVPLIRCHEDSLYEGILQILDNAYHFTPPDGHITISVSYNQTQVYIDVRDTGPGIEEAVLPHIFDVFWRQDVAHTTSGFGLGLSIAQKTFRQCGGDLTVLDPSAGRCTFRINLHTVG